MPSRSARASSAQATSSTLFDLDAYCARVGYAGPRTATAETLQAIIQHHTQTIPFENLNPFFRLPVKLDAASLQNKMVHSRRGGFCFEQNGLLRQTLLALGFTIRPLSARVVWNRPPGQLPPRTHMILHVPVADEVFHVDVGFGGNTPTAPLRLVTEIEQETPHQPYRFQRVGDDFLLETKLGDEWKALYRFDLSKQHQADYELSNWYVCHHPDSHFISGVSAALAAPGRRYALRDHQLSIHHTGGISEQHQLTSVAELRETLETVFHIEIPAVEGADDALRQLIPEGTPTASRSLFGNLRAHS